MYRPQTIEQLRSLRLSGMADALLQQQEQPGTYAELGFEERLSLLIHQEQLSRDNRRLSRLVHTARFKLVAHLAQIDYREQRGLNKRQVAELGTGGWIQQHHNVLITGPCGTGKTYLSCALGMDACLKGYSARYYRISRLLADLTLSHADGSYRRLLNSLARTQVLILDDWGLEDLTPPQRNDLLEVMDDRHGASSTIIASQLPTTQWHQSLGDATLADAILDRLMHNAHRVTLKGESIRKLQGKKEIESPEQSEAH